MNCQVPKFLAQCIFDVAMRDIYDNVSPHHLVQFDRHSTVQKGPAFERKHA